MYGRRGPLSDSHDLNQGDLLANALRPLPPTDKNLCLVDSGNRSKLVWPLPDAALQSATLPKELRVQVRPERLAWALVLSNSCDNAGDSDVLLVPVRSYKFSDGVRTDAERWADVSEAATGTASLKYFYLPESPEYGLPRSEAMLTEVFPVTHEFLKASMERCGEFGLKRICGLTAEATRHLQWQWGALISRNPREDLAWPSKDDLRLKLAWLEENAERGGHRREQLEKEREALRKAFGSAASASEPQAAPDSGNKGP